MKIVLFRIFIFLFLIVLKIMLKQIYLDYNATTPCDPSVLDKMLPYFTTDFGNPSSSNHHYGWMAKDAIEEAKNKIASLLDIPEKDFLFTSGATESINSILKSVYEDFKSIKNHFIITKTEHKAVLDCVAYLEQLGAEITYLDVDENGLIKLDELERSITPRTVLASIMLANNETGVIQPIDKIANVLQANDVLLFSDATQALGKISLDNFFSHVDFACFSAHKVYGPKGVGITYVKNNNYKYRFIHGGGQQKTQRGGTLNSPGIIGFAKAIEVAYSSIHTELNRIKNLRDYLEHQLLQLEAVHINGKNALRLPNTSNICFDYIDGERFLQSLNPYMAISNGSACNSSSVEPSHVITAMGLDKSKAHASMRFSLGKYTTKEDIDQVIAIMQEQVANQRENNILWDRR